MDLLHQFLVSTLKKSCGVSVIKKKRLLKAFFSFKWKKAARMWEKERSGEGFRSLLFSDVARGEDIPLLIPILLAPLFF